MKNNAFTTRELVGHGEINKLFAKNRVDDIGCKCIVLTSIDVRNERNIMDVGKTMAFYINTRDKMHLFMANL